MTLLTSEQLQKLQVFVQSLSRNQLIWISGYISGLLDTHISNDSVVKSDSKISEKLIQIQTYNNINNDNNIRNDNVITIISASQTGNASYIAKQLYDELTTLGSNVVLFNAGNYKFKKISEVRLLVFITSTYGSGEPPEEAIPLYQYLFSKKAPKLKNTSFAVLSLGDRSYAFFAKAGKDFDNRFEELGGIRLCDRLDIDIESVREINIWKKQIISVFMTKEPIASQLNRENIVSTQNSVQEYTVYTKEFPLVACLSNRQKITSRNSIKDIHHLEIDVTGSKVFYQPGDSLGVWYENDPQLIDELLKKLCLTGYELVKVKEKSISLKEALRKYYELTQNHPLVVQSIADISKNKLLLDLFKDSERLNNFVATTPIIDLIQQISSKITPQGLLQILRPMKPRFYSISSSQSEVGEEIHITVSSVRYKINGCFRSGGASSYLIDRLKENDKLRIFIEPNKNFRLPIDPNAPIIMIGAGTGIAPFRAFIQQRAFDQSIGKNWLFFGNLKFIDDFLYQIEWQNYIKSGVLNKIDTAWSRDQVHKIYIQDKLLNSSAEVWDWIQSGAYIYVCGDAKRMANDVEHALILLTSKHGNMSLEEANDFWNSMRIEHRYQRDVY